MLKKNLKNIFRNKKVIITGGTGSLGRELTSIFLKNFNLKRLVIFSRDELKQSEMIKKYQHQDKRGILRFFLGDVRDLSRMKFAMRDVDYVIHAAALKHVDLAEYNPLEYINTNIIGAKLRHRIHNEFRYLMDGDQSSGTFDGTLGSRNNGCIVVPDVLSDMT